MITRARYYWQCTGETEWRYGFSIPGIVAELHRLGKRPVGRCALARVQDRHSRPVGRIVASGRTGALYLRRD